MNSEFDNFSVPIESDVLSQDFDSIDLYGDIMEEDNTDDFGNDIEYE